MDGVLDELFKGPIAVVSFKDMDEEANSTQQFVSYPSTCHTTIPWPVTLIRVPSLKCCNAEHDANGNPKCDR